MITKYRTPRNRYFGHEKVHACQFERETDKCLFDAKGRKTMKENSYEIFHDTEDKANAHIEMLRINSERKKSLQRINDCAVGLLDSLVSVTETLETVCENCGWLKSDFPQIAKARAVIAEAKGDKS